MPIYTYKCSFCNEETEQNRKIAERDTLMLCRRCRKPVDRQIDRPGMVWAPTAGGMKV